MISIIGNLYPNTGAKPVYYNGEKITPDTDFDDLEDDIYFQYDGSHWNILTADAAVYTTDANGYLETGSLPVASGYYFLKETKASPGYELDTSYWRIKVSDVTGGNNVKYTVVKFSDNSSTTLYNTTTSSPLTIDLTTEDGTSYEPPKTWSLKLLKDSANKSMTDGNGVYSLAGAEYSLYYGTSTSIDDATLYQTSLAKTDYTGTSDTVPPTMAKTATCNGFVLGNGVTVKLTLTYGWYNIYGDGTLNVNSTGAYPIYYNGEAYDVDNSGYDINDGDTVYLRFDGSHWNIITEDELVVDYTGTSTTIPPEFGKTATCDGFVLSNGVLIALTVTYGWYTGVDTLNVNSTGAYPIYYNGEAYDVDNSGYDIEDGDTVYLQFDGSHWNIVELADITGDAVYTTDANGYLETGSLPVASGYYFLKETKASPGYELDTSYWRIKVSDVTGGNNVKYTVVKFSDNSSKTLYNTTTTSPLTIDLTTEDGTSYEPPKTWSLKLQKDSANKSMTDGNGVYSLAGAEYSLYYGTSTSIDDATVYQVNGSDAVYTTDANGYLETGSLPVASGYYFLKETKASPGYELDTSYWRIKVSDVTGGNDVKYTVVKFSDNSSKTLYNTTTSSPLTIDLTTESGRSYEPPANDPFVLTLSKKDSEVTKPISGAIFELQYYTNTDGKAEGDPYNKWYFMTDAEGNLDCSNEDYFISDPKRLNDGSTIIISDDLYYDNDGKIAYPVGTYVFKEIQTGDGYLLEGDMTLSNGDAVDVTKGVVIVMVRNDEPTYNEVTQKYEYGTSFYHDGVSVGNRIDAKNLAVDAFNGIKVKLNIIKLGDNEKPLQGVKFKLVGDDESVYMVETDENGEATFENMIPQHYTLTEVSTLDGYTLLEDNISVTLPLYMTEEEIKESGADISKAYYSMTEDKYFFTELTYTIDNTITLNLPMTGMRGSAKIYIPLICGIILAGMVSVYAFGRKKRKKQAD